jgi:hypothetical protein
VRRIFAHKFVVGLTPWSSLLLMNSDTFVNEFICNSALLTLLDKIYQNEHPLHSPVAMEGDDEALGNYLRFWLWLFSSHW